MSRRHLAGLVALVAGASPSLPGDAEPPWARAGEWALTLLPGGGCIASRNYPGGTQMQIVASGTRTALSVYGPGLSPFVFGTYSMNLVARGERRALVPGNKDKLHFRGLGVSFEPAFTETLSAASALEVDGPDGALRERLDLNGLGAALDRLPACLAEARARPVAGPIPSPPVPPAGPPPPSPQGKARRARAPEGLPSLFSSDDYPREAIAAGQEGRVSFRLEIDRRGRVTDCSITVSSGSPALDSTTCRLLVERARFEPARDRKGKPSADSFNGRIVWALPSEAPPPPP